MSNKSLNADAYYASLHSHRLAKRWAAPCQGDRERYLDTCLNTPCDKPCIISVKKRKLIKIRRMIILKYLAEKGLKIDDMKNQHGNL